MQKLPLALGQEISVRSREREYFQVNSKVLGAKVGEFILLDRLVVEMNNRLFVRLQGEVRCTTILHGNAYIFESQVLDTIAYDMSLISYPKNYEVKSLRKHTRLRINLPATFTLEGVEGQCRGQLLDLSDGGCRLLVDKVFYVDNKMRCQLELTLPSGQMVKALSAAIRSINVSKLRRTIDLGLQFIGPKEEIGKISGFCDFCRRFKL